MKSTTDSLLEDIKAEFAEVNKMMEALVLADDFCICLRFDMCGSL